MLHTIHMAQIDLHDQMVVVVVVTPQYISHWLCNNLRGQELLYAMVLIFCIVGFQFELRSHDYVVTDSLLGQCINYRKCRALLRQFSFCCNDQIFSAIIDELS